jgi:hypothetical protein
MARSYLGAREPADVLRMTWPANAASDAPDVHRVVEPGLLGWWVGTMSGNRESDIGRQS